MNLTKKELMSVIKLNADEEMSDMEFDDFEEVISGYEDYIKARVVKLESHSKIVEREVYYSHKYLHIKDFYEFVVIEIERAKRLNYKISMNFDCYARNKFGLDIFNRQDLIDIIHHNDEIELHGLRTVHDLIRSPNKEDYEAIFNKCFELVRTYNNFRIVNNVVASAISSEQSDVQVDDFKL